MLVGEGELRKIKTEIILEREVGDGFSFGGRLRAGFGFRRYVGGGVRGEVGVEVLEKG